MIKFKNSMASILVLSGLLVGCNRSDSNNNCVEDFTGALDSNEQLLVGTWTLTAIDSETEIDLTNDGEDNPSTDIYAQYSDCQQDAKYSFDADRTYSYEQGQTASQCANKFDVTGTWKLSGQTLGLTNSCLLQNLNVDFDTSFSTFSVTSLVNVTDVSSNTIQTNVTFVYTQE